MILDRKSQRNEDPGLPPVARARGPAMRANRAATVRVRSKPTFAA